MKKIIIGRGRECDIRLNDSTDKVSRKQAVITVTPFGKMKIYDTSSNGTFVNGVRIEKPNGVTIKRGDNINFAYLEDLDWNKVKDPYRSAKILLGCAIVLIAVLLVAFFMFGDEILGNNKKDVKSEQEQSATTATEKEEIEELELQTPQETPTPGVPATPTRQTGKTKPGTDAKAAAKEIVNDLNESEKANAGTEAEKPATPIYDSKLEKAMQEQEK